jgi:hypothetical protein
VDYVEEKNHRKYSESTGKSAAAETPLGAPVAVTVMGGFVTGPTIAWSVTFSVTEQLLFAGIDPPVRLRLGGVELIAVATPAQVVDSPTDGEITSPVGNVSVNATPDRIPAFGFAIVTVRVDWSPGLSAPNGVENVLVTVGATAVAVILSLSVATVEPSTRALIPKEYAPPTVPVNVTWKLKVRVTEVSKLPVNEAGDTAMLTPAGTGETPTLTVEYVVTGDVAPIVTVLATPVLVPIGSVAEKDDGSMEFCPKTALPSINRIAVNFSFINSPLMSQGPSNNMCWWTFAFRAQRPWTSRISGHSVGDWGA